VFAVVVVVVAVAVVVVVVIVVNVVVVDGVDVVVVVIVTFVVAARIVVIAVINIAAVVFIICANVGENDVVSYIIFDTWCLHNTTVIVGLGFLKVITGLCLKVCLALCGNDIGFAFRILPLD